MGPVQTDDDEAVAEERAPSSTTADLLLRSAQASPGMVCA
jgi:hypothetical protein